MNLPRPPHAYDVRDQTEARGAIERADKQNQKIGAPILLTSPDGKRWELTVDNAGALSATLVS